jgi:uncharacterized protein (DUF433 family)
VSVAASSSAIVCAEEPLRLVGGGDRARAIGRHARLEARLHCLPLKVGAMREELIQADPSIMMGKPVIVGTRVTVELILEKLVAGETIEQILAAHPRLTREAIQAALAFAVRTLRADVVYPIKQTGT